MKQYCFYESPIGRLLLAGADGVLEELHFANSPGQEKIIADSENYQYDAAGFTTVIRQLSEYFAGRRQEFDLKIAPQGTVFQQRVWRELQKIPFGGTASYGEIAGRTGNPKASRAVGMANSKNPIPIIVPCHRVIGRDGSLTGFGGGLEVKKQLLKLENGAYSQMKLVS